MYNNRMEAEFAIIWKRESDLGGSLWVSTFDDSLSGTLTVHRPPKNRMEVEVRALLPERHEVKASVIKDTYVTDYRPTLNYGESSIMKVGTDKDGYVFRSLVQFGIPEDLQRMRITKAKMKLYSDDPSPFMGLEISYPDKEWGEYNVVWMGQPSRKSAYKTVNLESGLYEHIIDVTEAVRDLWNVHTHQNFGFILKSEDESIIQMKNFGTKESTTPPEITIEYFDEDLFSTTGSVIGGRVNVRRTEWSDLGGKLNVWKDSGDSEIDGNVIVNHPDMTRGKITIAKLSQINGKITPHRPFSDMNGVINISTMPTNNLNGYLNVMHSKDIEGKVKVQELEWSDLDSKIPTTHHNGINGRVDVWYKSDLDGEVIVNPLEREDLDGRLPISSHNGLNSKMQVLYKSQIDGNVDVRYKNQLDGRIHVQTKGNTEIDGSIRIIYKSDLDGFIRTNPVGFKGRIVVDAVNGIDGKITISAKGQDLHGVFTTTLKNDMNGHINVRTMDIDDLYSQITVGEVPDLDEGIIYAFIM
ncbi:MAG: DNRLRE domain-containing protein [Clostridiaceae bacterium]